MLTLEDLEEALAVPSAKSATSLRICKKSSMTGASGKESGENPDSSDIVAAARIPAVSGTIAKCEPNALIENAHEDTNFDSEPKRDWLDLLVPTLAPFTTLLAESDAGVDDLCVNSTLAVQKTKKSFGERGTPVFGLEASLDDASPQSCAQTSWATSDVGPEGSVLKSEEQTGDDKENTMYIENDFESPTTVTCAARRAFRRQKRAVKREMSNALISPGAAIPSSLVTTSELRARRNRQSARKSRIKAKQRDAHAARLMQTLQTDNLKLQGAVQEQSVQLAEQNREIDRLRAALIGQTTGAETPFPIPYP